MDVIYGTLCHFQVLSVQPKGIMIIELFKKLIDCLKTEVDMPVKVKKKQYWYKKVKNSSEEL